MSSPTTSHFVGPYSRCWMDHPWSPCIDRGPVRCRVFRAALRATPQVGFAILQGLTQWTSILRGVAPWRISGRRITVSFPATGESFILAEPWGPIAPCCLRLLPAARSGSSERLISACSRRPLRPDVLVQTFTGYALLVAAGVFSLVPLALEPPPGRWSAIAKA